MADNTSQHENDTKGGPALSTIITGKRFIGIGSSYSDYTRLIHLHTYLEKEVMLWTPELQYYKKFKNTRTYRRLFTNE